MKIVCAWCKKTMRETFSHKQVISHGICPECQKLHFPEYADKKMRDLFKNAQKRE